LASGLKPATKGETDMLSSFAKAGLALAAALAILLPSHAVAGGAILLSDQDRADLRAADDDIEWKRDFFTMKFVAAGVDPHVSDGVVYHYTTADGTQTKIGVSTTARVADRAAETQAKNPKFADRPVTIVNGPDGTMTRLEAYLLEWEVQEDLRRQGLHAPRDPRSSSGHTSTEVFNVGSDQASEVIANHQNRVLILNASEDPDRRDRAMQNGSAYARTRDTATSYPGSRIAQDWHDEIASMVRNLNDRLTSRRRSALDNVIRLRDRL
jgi:hypothetical protein